MPEMENFFLRELALCTTQYLLPNFLPKLEVLSMNKGVEDTLVKQHHPSSDNRYKAPLYIHLISTPTLWPIHNKSSSYFTHRFSNSCWDHISSPEYRHLLRKKKRKENLQTLQLVLRWHDLPAPLLPVSLFWTCPCSPVTPWKHFAQNRTLSFSCSRVSNSDREPLLPSARSLRSRFLSHGPNHTVGLLLPN